MSEEIKKTPRELSKENNMSFATKLKDELSSIDVLKKSDVRKKVDTDRIATALEDPYNKADDLQQQNENMRVLNGTLKEIEFYKANILTYDHYLVPIDPSKMTDVDSYFKDMRTAGQELMKYNIKTLCPWLIEMQIRLGEIYIYKQETGDGITFYKLPNKICKITHSKEFMNGYSIKLKDIREKELGYYPKEIQDLWLKANEGKLSNDENYVDNYYRLEIEKAVAFSPEILESKGIPYYSGLLLDLSRIKDLDDLNMDNAETDNFKLITQTLPSNEDGEITIDYMTAMQYHEALKNAVCDGIGVVSTPYPVNAVSLTSNSAKNYDYINSLKEDIYNTSGVDSSLFNSQKKSNNQSTIYSALLDSILAKNLLQRLAIWLNYDFQSNSVLKNYRIIFCDSTIYDKDAKIQSACGRLATWSSKLEYLALQGHSPLESVNLLQLESQIDFGSIMKPLINSHVMSGEDVEGGRPTADESGDDPNLAPNSEE